MGFLYDIEKWKRSFRVANEGENRWKCFQFNNWLGLGKPWHEQWSRQSCSQSWMKMAIFIYISARLIFISPIWLPPSACQVPRTFFARMVVNNVDSGCWCMVVWYATIRNMQKNSCSRVREWLVKLLYAEVKVFQGSLT